MAAWTHDDAHAARRSTQMDRWRQQRASTPQYGDTGAMSEIMGFMIFGLIVLVSGVIAAAVSWQMATGEEPYSHGVFAAWGAFAASIVGMACTVLYLRGRRIALRQASEALAAQLRGQPISSTSQLVAWLNQYWAAEYDMRRLRAPGTYGGAYGSFEGFAVAAECSGSVQKGSRERVQLFVAAFIPEISDGAAVPQQLPADAEQHRHWLSSQGYRVSISMGGVYLDAEPGAVKHVDRDLSRFAQLAPVLYQACLLARALGGVPVGPH